MKKVSEWHEATCGCATKCSQSFSITEIVELRAESSALDYYDKDHSNRLDLVIKSQLRALTSYSDSTQRSKKLQTTRQRPRTMFRVKGFVVCKNTYFFIHTISKMRFTRIFKSFTKDGLTEIQHGNARKCPSNVTSFSIVENIVRFLTNYANQHALFLPGRTGSQRNVSAKLLPSSDTKYKVYQVR